jgi:hypothetical protein
MGWMTFAGSKVVLAPGSGTIVIGIDILDTPQWGVNLEEWTQSDELDF